MKLKEIYELAVRMGMEADPRGKGEAERVLRRAREEYDRLTPDDQSFFDEERFTNPYSDTRLLVGDAGAEVGGVIAGIDMEIGEVLLADRLREKGEPLDAIIAHHPEGSALAALSEVMRMQADLWHVKGVPINVADALIAPRMREVFRQVMPLNHNRALDAARLLDFALLTVHTPTDNLVTGFLQRFFDEDPPETLSGVVKKLRTLPEYQTAARQRFGPAITVGDPDTRVGKIFVDMTGGTGGPKEAIAKLSQAGVGTLVGMHMQDKVRKEAERHNVNVVIAGHISSDSLGVNLFLDELEKRGVSVLPCSGLIRVKRYQD